MQVMSTAPIGWEILENGTLASALLVVTHGAKKESGRVLKTVT